MGLTILIVVVFCGLLKSSSGLDYTTIKFTPKVNDGSAFMCRENISNFEFTINATAETNVPTDGNDISAKMYYSETNIYDDVVKGEPNDATLSHYTPDGQSASMKFTAPVILASDACQTQFYLCAAISGLADCKKFKPAIRAESFNITNTTILSINLEEAKVSLSVEFDLQASMDTDYVSGINLEKVGLYFTDSDQFESANKSSEIITILPPGVEEMKGTLIKGIKAVFEVDKSMCEFTDICLKIGMKFEAGEVHDRWACQKAPEGAKAACGAEGSNGKKVEGPVFLAVLMVLGTWVITMKE